MLHLKLLVTFTIRNKKKNKQKKKNRIVYIENNQTDIFLLLF